MSILYVFNAFHSGCGKVAVVIIGAGHTAMALVYLADAQREERSALRLLLLHLNMEVVGEAADWPTSLAQAPGTRLDMLLVDWDLLPIDLGAVLG